MVPSEVFETVCPACKEVFEVDEGMDSGRCPFCDRVLRFEFDDEPETGFQGPSEVASPERTMAAAPSVAPKASERSYERAPPRRGKLSRRERRRLKRQARRDRKRSRHAPPEQGWDEPDEEEPAARREAPRRATKPSTSLSSEPTQSRSVARAPERPTRTHSGNDVQVAGRKPRKIVRAGPMMLMDRFRVVCPQCASGITVARDDRGTECRHCGATLKLHDQFGPATCATQCPDCDTRFQVPLDAYRATCPGCDARLRLEDVWAGQADHLRLHDGATRGAEVEPASRRSVGAASVATGATVAAAGTAAAASRPKPKPSPTPQDEDDDAWVDDDEDDIVIDEDEEPEIIEEEEIEEEWLEDEPQPSTARQEPEMEVEEEIDEPVVIEEEEEYVDEPVRQAPEDVECPSCNKSHRVPEGRTEGVCPYCKAPLAYVSEREAERLQRAERRKKEFQGRQTERKRRVDERNRPRGASDGRARRGFTPWRSGRRATNGDEPATARKKEAAWIENDPPRRAQRGRSRTRGASDGDDWEELGDVTVAEPRTTSERATRRRRRPPIKGESVIDFEIEN